MKKSELRNLLRSSQIYQLPDLQLKALGADGEPVTGQLPQAAAPGRAHGTELGERPARGHRGLESTVATAGGVPDGPRAPVGDRRYQLDTGRIPLDPLKMRDGFFVACGFTIQKHGQ